MPRPTVQERREAAQRQLLERAQASVARRRDARLAAEHLRMYIYSVYLDALTLTMLVDEIIDQYRPRVPGEDPHPAFCAALRAREQVREIVKDLAVLVSIQEENR